MNSAKTILKGRVQPLAEPRCEAREDESGQSRFSCIRRRTFRLGLVAG